MLKQTWGGETVFVHVFICINSILVAYLIKLFCHFICPLYVCFVSHLVVAQYSNFTFSHVHFSFWKPSQLSDTIPHPTINDFLFIGGVCS